MSRSPGRLSLAHQQWGSSTWWSARAPRRVPRLFPLHPAPSNTADLISTCHAGPPPFAYRLLTSLSRLYAVEIVTDLWISVRTFVHRSAIHPCGVIFKIRGIHICTSSIDMDRGVFGMARQRGDGGCYDVPSRLFPSHLFSLPSSSLSPDCFSPPCIPLCEPTLLPALPPELPVLQQRTHITSSGSILASHLPRCAGRFPSETGPSSSGPKSVSREAKR